MRPLWHVWAMLRSLRHGRPLLNDYASYYPAGWDTRMAAAGRLPDAKALASLVRETGVTTIVVRLDSLLDWCSRAGSFPFPLRCRDWCPC
jgi:hypothetical protein